MWSLKPCRVASDGHTAVGRITSGGYGLGNRRRRSRGIDDGMMEYDEEDKIVTTEELA
jgi:hypothetical protein